MKFKGAILLSLLFFGTAFSQDSSFVPLPQDTIMPLPQDTIVPFPQDTIVLLPQDTAFVPLPDAIDIFDTTSRDTTIKPGFYFFALLGVQFIDFKDRAKFQNLLDIRFAELKASYLEDSLGLFPQKQDFQKVNLTFPIAAGLIWQLNDMHSFGLGLSFLYSNESVILVDKHGENYNLRYALRAFPLFTEYRLLISPDLISLRNGDYFSLFLRYYWMLPGTEIYSTWGKAKADFEPLGNGFGVFLGYRFAEWERLSFFGEIGYSSLDVKSSDKNRVLASWNLGGISIFIRIMI
ncbi:MAG: hypothetical protein LBC85_00440 [Fibromonadaceae bacterium]|jgi:hypothetical protein|nr:hypothetical protein [Fibromonadaceae bacterium]